MLGTATHPLFFHLIVFLARPTLFSQLLPGNENWRTEFTNTVTLRSTHQTKPADCTELKVKLLLLLNNKTLIFVSIGFATRDLTLFRGHWLKLNVWSRIDSLSRANFNLLAPIMKAVISLHCMLHLRAGSLSFFVAALFSQKRFCCCDFVNGWAFCDQLTGYWIDQAKWQTAGMSSKTCFSVAENIQWTAPNHGKATTLWFLRMKILVGIPESFRPVNEQHEENFHYLKLSFLEMKMVVRIHVSFRPVDRQTHRNCSPHHILVSWMKMIVRIY